MKCIACLSETTNPKFCSRSCAAKFNNAANPKRKPEHECRVCKYPITSDKIFCSDECKSKFVKEKPSHVTCGRCLQTFPATEEFFYRRNQRNDLATGECRECFKERIYQRSKEQKHFAVQYKGGKCVLCGYNKCEAGLAFHHVDPSKKEFNFRSAASRERLIKELDKCILVCHNCHAEIHQGFHPQYLIVKDQS